MHDLNAVIEECKHVLDLHKIPYAADCNIKISTRMHRTWGFCKKERSGIYTIRISSLPLDDAVPVNSLKNTVYHELLHTVPGAMNHQKKWTQLAKAVSHITGLDIKRCSTATEMGVAHGQSQVKFLCVCSGCGSKFIRYRTCNFTRHNDRYRCGNCGGRLNVVIDRL